MEQNPQHGGSGGGNRDTIHMELPRQLAPDAAKALRGLNTNVLGEPERRTFEDQITNLEKQGSTATTGQGQGSGR